MLRLMAGDSRPGVLMGDMNDVASSTPIQLLSSRLNDAFLASGVGPAGTFPLPLGLGAPHAHTLRARDDARAPRVDRRGQPVGPGASALAYHRPSVGLQPRDLAPLPRFGPARVAQLVRAAAL